MLDPKLVENVINEATYYGSNDKLKECEVIIQDAINIARNKGTASLEFIRKIDELSKMLADIFGFHSVEINNSLYMYQPLILLPLLEDRKSRIKSAKRQVSRFNIKGATVAYSAFFKYINVVHGTYSTKVISFDKDHKGVKFSKSYNETIMCRMYLSTELFMRPDEFAYTAREVLAIILHEIGHNFYIGPVKELGLEFFAMATAPDILSYINGISTGLILECGSYVIDLFLPKNLKDVTSIVYNSITTMFTFVNVHVRTLLFILNMAYMVTRKVIVAPASIVRAFMEYDSEKYADAFATAYGYGADLHTALSKSKYSKNAETFKSVNGNIFFQLITLLYHVPANIYRAILDEHPNMSGRLKNDIRYMEEARKHIANPRILAEYDVELDKMKKLREEDINYRGWEADRNITKYRAIVQDVLNVSDVKDSLTTLDPKHNKYINLDK